MSHRVLSNGQVHLHSYN